ncbi:MAG: hypothetical protein JSV03_11340 [Planctomycetota bacterium]|nr:MAG: hypothetical protein JSV03_11340 [Planctomycetota bacterium]
MIKFPYSTTLMFILSQGLFVNAEPLKPSAWQPSAHPQEISFSIGSKFMKYRISKHGDKAARLYFDEFVPALFERTLMFDEIQLQDDEALEWIFTGDRGGITVRIQKSVVTVNKRYYDTYGLSPATKEKPHAPRNPEKQVEQFEVDFQGDLKSVTVIMDHQVSVSILINGVQVIRELCAFDLARHQLRMAGDKSYAQGKLLLPTDKTTTVTINPSKHYQTMLGFGGITTPTAYAQLSPVGKFQWWRYVTEYNLLIQREFPNGERLNPQMSNFDDLAVATPHSYGDNFPNGEVSDFNYLKTLRQLNGTVFFEYWALPLWARQEWRDEATGKSRNGVANPDKLVATIIRYCQLCKEGSGAPPEVVGIQNEQTQPTEIWHQLTLTLRRELDRAGFNTTRIHMADAPTLKGGTIFAGNFKKSPQAWEKIDYAATHMYDYQSNFSDPDLYDTKLKEFKNTIGNKPFLSTELCINHPHWQRYNYRIALSMGQLYYKNLTITDASAICYCWMLLNVVQPSYGWSRSLFVPDKAHGFLPKPSSYQLRVLGAYSRRIHKGMVRVDASSSDPNLLSVAFAGDNNALTVIMINRSTAVQRVSLKGIKTKFNYCEYVDQYNENSLQQEPSGSTIAVRPGQIVTLSTVPLKELPADFVVFGK